MYIRQAFPLSHARMGIPDERGRSPATRRDRPGPSFGEPACAMRPPMRPPSALRTTGPAAAPGSLPGQPRTGHGRTGARGTSRYGPGSRTRAGSGTARFSSPLGVDDFVKKSSFIYYTRDALGKVQSRIADFAEHEGLHAHAKSVTIRFEDQ